MYLKTMLISLLIALLAITKTPAQGYIPLPDSNATWNLDFYSINCPPPFGYCYSASFSLIKDTLIGNYTYHLTDYPPGSGGGFIPAFRQDIPNKRTYFPWEFPSNSGIYVDTILFDYSMQVGDSIPDIISGSNLYFKVLTIDSIFNGNMFIKRFIIVNNGSIVHVYEGVGNQYGLFGFFYAFEGSPQVVCMTKDNQSFFPNATTSCIPISVSENDFENDLSIYPSIAESNQEIKVNCSTKYFKCKSIRILDMSGLQKSILKPVSNNFSITNLKAGLYVVIIESEYRDIVVRKLIII